MDLAILNILINTSLDGRDACPFAYDVQIFAAVLGVKDGIGACPIYEGGTPFMGQPAIAREQFRLATRWPTQPLGAFPTNPKNFTASRASPNGRLSISDDDSNSTTGNPRSTRFKFAQVLIQNTLDARRACYLGFDQDNNLLYFLNDEGTRLIYGGAQPRTAKSGWQMLGFLAVPR